jgi:hypothetical protein
MHCIVALLDFLFIGPAIRHHEHACLLFLMPRGVHLRFCAIILVILVDLIWALVQVVSHLIAGKALDV